jgi:hypothetical protein
MQRSTDIRNMLAETNRFPEPAVLLSKAQERQEFRRRNSGYEKDETPN